MLLSLVAVTKAYKRAEPALPLSSELISFEIVKSSRFSEPNQDKEVDDSIATMHTFHKAAEDCIWFDADLGR